MEPKYPDIEVQLTGHDGNAFAVIGAVGAALKRAGVAEAEVVAFYREATASDYDSLLATCMRWVEVS